jgi:hypothetical protein
VVFGYRPDVPGVLDVVAEAFFVREDLGDTPNLACGLVKDVLVELEQRFTHA